MKYQINGTTLQSLEIVLEQGESIYSQTHQMSWMSDNLHMDTHTGGGFLQGLMRGMAGGSVFVTEFRADRGRASVAFCPRFPGTIVARQLQAGETLICRKETFLCAQSSVKFEIAFRQQVGSGLFGGEGFILQKITGPGTVFLDLSGEIVEKSLQPGERLLVHVGHVGVQDASVHFDIQMLPGFKNILFGGNGMFVATLTGPGKVILQSMPIMNLAEEIMRHVHIDGTATSGDTEVDAAGKMIGGVIKGIFGGQ